MSINYGDQAAENSISLQIYYQFIQLFENIITTIVEGSITVLKKKTSVKFFKFYHSPIKVSLFMTFSRYASIFYSPVTCAVLYCFLLVLFVSKNFSVFLCNLMNVMAL